MPSSDLNPFLLAALTPNPDPRLLPLLHSQPHLASQQDSNGYSLLHAASSYNHLSLLTTLLSPPFSVDINITDNDNETALCYAETVEMAQLLLSHGVDMSIVNGEGQTALVKFSEEGEFAEIVELLRRQASGGRGQGQGQGEGQANGTASTNEQTESQTEGMPRLPPNIQMNVTTHTQAEAAETEAEPDPEFRRRIEELAAKENFQSEEGQRELRELITDAVRGVSDENERHVRRRVG